MTRWPPGASVRGDAEAAAPSIHDFNHAECHIIEKSPSDQGQNQTHTDYDESNHDYSLLEINVVLIRSSFNCVNLSNDDQLYDVN